MSWQLLIVLGLATIACETGSTGRMSIPSRTDSQVRSERHCEDISAREFPGRALTCPSGTRLMVLSNDGGVATKATGRMGPTVPPRRHRPKLQLHVTGGEFQWCTRGSVRHGPYRANFPKHSVVIHGQYLEGKKTGIWTYWSSGGYLLRYRVYGGGVSPSDVRCDKFRKSTGARRHEI